MSVPSASRITFSTWEDTLYLRLALLTTSSTPSERELPSPLSSPGRLLNGSLKLFSSKSKWALEPRSCRFRLEDRNGLSSSYMEIGPVGLSTVSHWRVH